MNILYYDIYYRGARDCNIVGRNTRRRTYAAASASIRVNEGKKTLLFNFPARAFLIVNT